MAGLMQICSITAVSTTHNHARVSKRTNADRVPNEVRVQRVERARAKREAEADAFELRAEEGARFAVDLGDGHSRCGSAERDEVFLDG